MPAITYSSPQPGDYRLDVPGMAGSSYPGLDGTGYGGGIDLSWIADFARKQAQNKLAMQNFQLKQMRAGGSGRPVDPRMAVRPAAMTPAQQQQEIDRARQQSVRGWMDFGDRTQTEAQRAVSSIGGLTSRAYGDMANQIGARTAAGVPVGDYTGMTELARAGSGASAAAVDVAGRNALAGGPSSASQDLYRVPNPNVLAMMRGLGPRG